MSKRQWLMVFGFLVLFLPFLGFPFSWLKVLLLILGILIISVSYSLVKAQKRPVSSESLPFSESQKITKQV